MQLRVMRNRSIMYQVALSTDIAIFSFYFLSLHLYKITSRTAYALINLTMYDCDKVS
jgi:multidrug transporter EmrE-like cation transporter